MWDLWFICFFYIIVSLFTIVIMICTTASGTTNQDVESMQRNCNNSDLDQETFERIVVYLPMIDFAHLAQDFSMSDLPPSYDSCVLETQPPSYPSTILIHHQ